MLNESCLKCYAWNVYKRILNNHFSSCLVLFLTNMQHKKKLIFVDLCSNDCAFMVVTRSHGISIK